MAWIDILVGCLFGVVACIVFKKRFALQPALTISVIILFILIGIAFSDLLLTPGDRPWNIIHRLVTFSLGQVHR